MPHPLEIACKHTVEAHPADWIALAGLPPGESLQVLDADDSAIIDFVFELLKACEMPVQSLPCAGLGTLPLTPIREAGEPSAATHISTAPKPFGQLLKAVQGMKESATYQEIVREGMEEGIA
jgi:hypothetical protein